MRKLILAAILAVPVATTRADDAADARAVVERAIKAANAPDVSKLTAMTWTDKGTITIADMKLEYTADWFVQLPGSYKFALSAEVMGQKLDLVLVVRDGKAWESAQGMTREVTDEKLEYVNGQAYQFLVISLTPLVSDKEFKLSPAGEKDVDGKKATGVNVERTGKPPIALYFDKASGLLVKCESRVKDEFQGWKEVTDEAYLGEYKDLDDRKVFTRMKLVRDGKPLLETTMSDMRLHERLDPKLFDKPGS